MTVSRLVRANDLAKVQGVKCLAFGPPGGGKTPLMMTAPNPVMLISEPGALSLRGCNLPAWEGYDAKSIEEFFDWLFNSKEANQFDTVCVDSLSQICEIFLDAEMKKTPHGLKAYGEMAKRVKSKVTNPLYFMENKHVYLICKETSVTDNEIQKFVPSFPGKELDTSIPHLYDLIIRVGLFQVPGVVKPQRAVRTGNAMDAKLRDRSGRLAEYEPQDLTHIFNKCMS